MEWHRKTVDPVWPIDRSNVPTRGDGQLCDHEMFRSYEALDGSWQGKGDGDATDLSFETYRVVGGCALMAFVQLGEREEFLFLTYNGPERVWEIDLLDDRRSAAPHAIPV